MRGTRLRALAARNGQPKSRRCRLLRLNDAFGTAPTANRVKITLGLSFGNDELQAAAMTYRIQHMSDTRRNANCFFVAVIARHAPCVHSAEGRPALSRRCACKRCCLAQPDMQRRDCVRPHCGQRQASCIASAKSKLRSCHDTAEQSSLDRTGLSPLCMHLNPAKGVASSAREGQPRVISGSFKFGNMARCLHPRA